jgi:bla regulator protein blaR1
MGFMLEQLNTMGQAFVEFAGPMLIESAVLIGLVLLVEFALRAKVRAALRYWLVTAVVVYLAVTPFLSLLPPSNFLPAGNAAFADPSTHLAAAHTRTPLSRPITGHSETTSVGVEESPPMLTWQGSALLLWLGGVVVMTAVVIRRAVTANRSIERSREANLLMNDIMLYCRKRMGIKGPVRLRIRGEGTKPAVCGLVAPIVVVPRNLAPTLGSRHLRDVIFHELAHVKRHDLWVNLGQNIVQVLYFYNPLLWVANKVIRRIREEAADEAVLETVAQRNHDYSRRLADVAGLTLAKRPAVNLCPMHVT